MVAPEVDSLFPEDKVGMHSRKLRAPILNHEHEAETVVAAFKSQSPIPFFFWQDHTTQTSFKQCNNRGAGV